MLSLTGLCTLLVAGSLFGILGYLAWQGASSLSLDFFTKLPAPVGESGGGMANAILGSGKVLLVAVCLGVPFGFLGGVYLPSSDRASFPASSATPQIC
jgi:phosphate transport system permease protein